MIYCHDLLGLKGQEANNVITKVSKLLNGTYLSVAHSLLRVLSKIINHIIFNFIDDYLEPNMPQNPMHT